MYKILPLGLLIFTLTACAQELKLVKATSVKNAGGGAGTPPSVIYTLYLKAGKPSPVLKADSLWVDGRYYPVEVKSGGNSGFKAGDTLRVFAIKPLRERKFGDDAPPEPGKQPGSTPPATTKGKAVLKYRVGKKVKYLPIKQFTQETPEARPIK